MSSQSQQPQSQKAHHQLAIEKIEKEESELRREIERQRAERLTLQSVLDTLNKESASTNGTVGGSPGTNGVKA